MLIEKSLLSDTQVSETAKLLKNTKKFDTILAKDMANGDTTKTASAFKPYNSAEH